MTHALPVGDAHRGALDRRPAGGAARPRDGFSVHYVRNGIDKSVFACRRVPAAPAPRVDGPLRVLVEGSPAVPFKGVDEALAAAARDARARARDARLRRRAPWSRRRCPRAPTRSSARWTRPAMAKRVRRRPTWCSSSRAWRAWPGRRWRAFTRGATCVTTPVTGHDEYIVRRLQRAADQLGRRARHLARCSTCSRATASCCTACASGALRTARVVAVDRAVDRDAGAGAAAGSSRRRRRTRPARPAPWPPTSGRHAAPQAAERDHERLARADAPRSRTLLSKGRRRLKVVRRAVGRARLMGLGIRPGCGGCQRAAASTTSTSRRAGGRAAARAGRRDAGAAGRRRGRCTWRSSSRSSSRAAAGT